MANVLPLRQYYGDALLKAGRENKKIVALDADVSKGTFSKFFGTEFPERFFNFGIAEQNMLAAAAGLASMGFIPFANSYAVFVTMRACEQLRNMIAYQRANVKVMGGHGGISVGQDGVSHQAIEDIAIVRSMSNMTVLVPGDPIEVGQVVEAALNYVGPVYIRLARISVPNLFQEGYQFKIGKGNIIKEGKDVTIMAIGIMVKVALDAAAQLEKQGISVRVVNMASVKPIDKELIFESAKKTGAIVTVEDHNVVGGLAGAVCEVLCELKPVPLEKVGLQDTFAESGDETELFKHYGLDTKDIINAAKKAIARKKG